MPAAKIIEFYEGMQQDERKYCDLLLFATSNEHPASKTMEELKLVSDDMMQLWLSQ